VTLDDGQLAELFDLGYHFKHVDTIFDRVFGTSGGGQGEISFRVLIACPPPRRTSR
jgi:hypothetical protein